MGKTVQQIPFLRLTVALALGIIAASHIQIPGWVSVLFSVSILLSLHFLNKNYEYRREALFGVGVNLLFFFLGTSSFGLYNIKPTFYENGKFLATVLESPQKKKNSYKSVLIINSFSNSQQNQFLKTHEKILAYFEPDSSVTNLSPGDKIIFNQSPQMVQNNGNPFEFDYKKYLERRKIFRQVYLPSAAWGETRLKASFSPLILAERTRDKLLERYREQNLGGNEFEILSALTLGYKRELDPEIKRVFSSAGAMHVLAVSGLHVGIIYWVLTTFLGFIKSKKTGRLAFALISLFCLWAYAFITGLSPSVMRAATMFSFIIIGNTIKRHGNIYNSLAASALILLLINPNNLFEVGFQLSYSAVFGIVYLQPTISNLITVKNRVLNYFWMLLTVSVAAQIATFPISVFYFNQFPTYFFISNLFVIPAVSLLIPLGILLLLFSTIPVISNIISLAINLILSSVYFLLKEIENLPFAVQKISITPIELIFIITFLASLLFLLKTSRITYLKLALVSVLLLACTSLFQKISLRKTNKLIVYNNPGNLIMQLISGKTNYVISENNIKEDDYEKNFIENTNVKMNLNAPAFLKFDEACKNEDLLLKNGVIFFKGKLILAGKTATPVPENFIPDFIVNPESSAYKKIGSPEPAIIITNKKNPPGNNRLSNQIFNVTKQGAYQKNW